MAYTYIDLPEELRFSKDDIVFVNGRMAKGVGRVIMAAFMTREHWPPKSEISYGLRSSEPFPQMAVEFLTADNYGLQLHYNADDIVGGKIRKATDEEVAGVTGITERALHPFVKHTFSGIEKVPCPQAEIGLTAALARYKESMTEPYPAEAYAELLFSSLGAKKESRYKGFVELPGPVSQNDGYRICDDLGRAIVETLPSRPGIYTNLSLDWNIAKDELFSRVEIEVVFSLASFLAGDSRSGGYGRDYYLGFERCTCHITGEDGPCLVFDSSDGEYAGLCISIALVAAIAEGDMT